MNTTDFKFTIVEQDAAQTLLNNINLLNNNESSTAILEYNYKDFTIPDNVEWRSYIRFNTCDFFRIDFEGVNGVNSYVNHSAIRNCSFKNCNLKNSNFTGTTFDHVSSQATSFDYSDFSNIDMFGAKFCGCSFSNCLFYQAKINDCNFSQTEFTNTLFVNVTFETLDFSNASFNNVEFRNCIFRNCILPFFKILHISYGLRDILVNQDVQLKTEDASHVVDSKNYLQEIHELLPVFYRNNDFIAMANTYIVIGNMSLAFQALECGMKYACKRKNWESIDDLCNIAGKNNFQSAQLKKLYNILTHEIDLTELNNSEYHRYLNHLAQAEELLLDSSAASNAMYISIETSYCYKETDKLAETLQNIYEVIDLIDSGLTNKVVIRHNSPPLFNVILSGDIYNLIFVFAAILYIFKKSTEYIEKIQQLIKNQNDIKLQKLNIKLKEIELLKAKVEKKNKSSILLPDDFSNISYLMKTTPDCPNALLRFESKNAKGISQL